MSAIEPRDTEVWRTIEGIGETKRALRYEISNLGRVRAIYRKTPPRILQTFVIRTSHGKGGKRYGRRAVARVGMEKRCVAHMVWRAFVGEIPDGINILHRNGMATDNRICNLYAATKSQSGKNGGGKRHKKRIAKINRDGEILALYRTRADAVADTPGTTIRYISDRCNHKVSDRVYWMADGTSFAWEHDLDPENLERRERYQRKRGQDK